jgi:hypothetical protein
VICKVKGKVREGRKGERREKPYEDKDDGGESYSGVDGIDN